MSSRFEEKIREAIEIGQAELDEIEVQYSALGKVRDERMKSLSSLKNMLGGKPPNQDIKGMERPAPQKKQALQGPSKEVLAVVDILKRSRQPMAFGEIWKEFTKLGMTIGGLKPRNTLNARVHNSFRANRFFFKTPDHKWALLEWKNKEIDENPLVTEDQEGHEEKKENLISTD